MQTTAAKRLRFFKLNLKFGDVKESRFVQVDAGALEQLSTFPKLDDIVESAIDDDQLNEGDADFITSFIEISESEYLDNL
jgi:hypothetical protein